MHNPSFLLLCCGLCCAVCNAEELPPSPAQLLSDGAYARINVLGYAQRQQLGTTPLNPGNIAGIPRDQAALEVRPDFNLKLQLFEFDLKPRFQYSASRIYHNEPQPVVLEEGSAFIHEGSVRARLGERLVLIYGRENLQWGPSALLSPSNPFNVNNGRNNPNLEMAAMDYASAVMVASPALTISLISNTDKGRLDPAARFRKTSAAKIDYTGDGHFLSVIASRVPGEGRRIGGFAGWNVSDALSVHAEGSAAQGGAAAATGRRDRKLLVGAAYTLAAGPTLTAEYFVNNDGCDTGSIQRCVQQRGAVVDPLRPLVRRRYAMLQYVDTKIGGNLNLSMRLIRNLDDRSGQLVVNLEYELGQHWQLYAIPTLYQGAQDSEFGSLLQKAVFVGASYTF
ncbi:MAG: hypothetical protein JWR56_91 [Massilia sp.]|nr:hypothetical protein [Massilia sp.]